MGEPLSANEVDVWAVWRRQARTSKRTGRVRRSNFRVDISFKPKDALVVNTDAREANQRFGNLLLELIAEQFQASRKRVSPETLARRERAKRPPGNLSRWYKRRYSGGRTGELEPGRGDIGKWGIDSGRLLTTMRVGLRQRSGGESAATINVAANRLDPRSFGSAGDFRRFVEDLRDEVPVLGGQAADDAESKRVLSDGLGELLEGYISHSRAKRRALKRQIRQQQLRIARRRLSLVRG